MKTGKRLLATSYTRHGIMKLVNEYFFSSSWTIDDNGNLYNEKLDKVSTTHTVENVNGKWKFFELDK